MSFICDQSLAKKIWLANKNANFLNKDIDQIHQKI